MATSTASTMSTLLATTGDFRWVRAHVSFFAVGAVLLVGANLLVAGARLWSLTAIGIWSMLLVVHLVLLAIARLSEELLTDDDEEIVVLPVQDAVIVNPQPGDPAATWSTNPDDAASTDLPEDSENETVSWQVATDLAQARRTPDSPTEAEPT